MDLAKIFVSCAAISASLLTAKAQETVVTWQKLGNGDGCYTQRFIVTGDMGFDKLAFNMFKRQMSPANPADTIGELLPGYFTISSPRFVEGADSVVIDIVIKGAFSGCSYAPDGLHRIEHDGTTRPVTYARQEITEPWQWQQPDGADRMPYGEYFYTLNANLADGKAGPYDIIPSYKKVELTGGVSNLPLAVRYKAISADMPEYYALEIANDTLTISAADKRTADMAYRSFQAQVLSSAGSQLPNAAIEDYPDFPYRGLMIDVSRNFQSIESMKTIIDYMAEYRLNRLHLHLIDDEGWRLEIAVLPELTQLGARRGYCPDEDECLMQIFSGDGNPDSPGCSNGFYTRQQYIDLLRYAYERGICVIPEVETPGHARAAVRAMEKRYRDTGDDTYRLIHDGDTSTYTTAQAYHDNVMNPALPGPYNFLGVVFDEIKAMHEAAGVPLLAIHIGGDEVARGAWSGSAAAQQLIADKGLDGQHGLHGYFIEKAAALLQERGIPMSGWQEIAVGHTGDFNAAMSPLAYSVNCWTESSADPAKNTSTRAIKAGFPVVISNVDHFYLDMCYNRHIEEPGLKWGGIVDEFASLHGYPAALVPGIEAGNSNIIGVSGQLFSETLRSPQMLQLYIFPKMLGLAERAWNADSTYTDADFNAVIAEKELPRWIADGRNFHLRQPGIRQEGGMIYMNSPYPQAEIRYTTDGTMPTASSALYTGPFRADGNSPVRARLFLGGKQSLATYQENNPNIITQNGE